MNQLEPYLHFLLDSQGVRLSALNCWRKLPSFLTRTQHYGLIGSFWGAIGLLSWGPGGCIQVKRPKTQMENWRKLKKWHRSWPQPGIWPQPWAYHDLGHGHNLEHGHDLGHDHSLETGHYLLPNHFLETDHHLVFKLKFFENCLKFKLISSKKNLI